MSLNVYELQRTFNEVQSNLSNENGLLPESKIELQETSTELLDELNDLLNSTLGQTVLFAAQFDMLGEPESTEMLAGESDPAAGLTDEQDALFPVMMIKQESN